MVIYLSLQSNLAPIFPGPQSARLLLLSLDVLYLIKFSTAGY